MIKYNDLKIDMKLICKRRTELHTVGRVYTVRAYNIDNDDYCRVTIGTDQGEALTQPSLVELNECFEPYSIPEIPNDRELFDTSTMHGFNYIGYAQDLVQLHKDVYEGKIVKTEAVNSPSHYNTGTIEVIDYIEDKKLDFNLGNAVKYISRAGHKNASKTIEDLQKAQWYVARAIARLEK